MFPFMASELAIFVEEHGELAAALVLTFNDLETAKRTMAESYYGCWDSLEDYAAETIAERYDLPEAILPYIDSAKFGRDLEMGGDIFTLETGDGRLHVFSNA